MKHLLRMFYNVRQATGNRRLKKCASATFRRFLPKSFGVKLGKKL